MSRFDVSCWKVNLERLWLLNRRGMQCDASKIYITMRVYFFVCLRGAASLPRGVDAFEIYTEIFRFRWGWAWNVVYRLRFLSQSNREIWFNWCLVLILFAACAADAVVGRASGRSPLLNVPHVLDLGVNDFVQVRVFNVLVRIDFDDKICRNPKITEKNPFNSIQFNSIPIRQWWNLNIYTLDGSQFVGVERRVDRIASGHRRIDQHHFREDCAQQVGDQFAPAAAAPHETSNVLIRYVFLQIFLQSTFHQSQFYSNAIEQLNETTLSITKVFGLGVASPGFLRYSSQSYFKWPAECPGNLISSTTKNPPERENQFGDNIN